MNAFQAMQKATREQIDRVINSPEFLRLSVIAGKANSPFATATDRVLASEANRQITDMWIAEVAQ